MVKTIVGFLYRGASQGRTKESEICFIFKFWDQVSGILMMLILERGWNAPLDSKG